MLLHCRRHCWQGLLALCLDVVENRLAPRLATHCSILHMKSVLGVMFSVSGIVTLGNSRSCAYGMFKEEVPSFVVGATP